MSYLAYLWCSRIVFRYTHLNLTTEMFTLILRYLDLSAGHQNWPLWSAGFPRCSSCSFCHCDGTVTKITLGKTGLNWLLGYNLSSRGTKAGCGSRNRGTLLAGLLSTACSAFLYNPWSPVWGGSAHSELGPPTGIIN